jgi:integrase
VTVDAACSKHRREDVLPLHADLVALLREWLPQLKPNEKLFLNLDRKKTWKMVKKDLACVSIPYETDEGVADFHGADRHTDVKMTMRYTHIGLEDQSKAVAGLRLPAPVQLNPSPLNESSEGDALQMRCIYCSAEGHPLTLTNRRN